MAGDFCTNGASCNHPGPCLRISLSGRAARGYVAAMNSAVRARRDEFIRRYGLRRTARRAAAVAAAFATPEPFTTH
jgi:hypothetical protein